MARLRVCFDAIHKLAHGVGEKSRVGGVQRNPPPQNAGKKEKTCLTTVELG